MPGNSYYIRGGYEVAGERVVGDGLYLPLFDGASMLGLALMSSLFASVTAVLI